MDEDKKFKSIISIEESYGVAQRLSSKKKKSFKMIIFIFKGGVRFLIMFPISLFFYSVMSYNKTPLF